MREEGQQRCLGVWESGANKPVLRKIVSVVTKQPTAGPVSNEGQIYSGERSFNLGSDFAQERKGSSGVWECGNQGQTNPFFARSFQVVIKQPTADPVSNEGQIYSGKRKRQYLGGFGPRKVS